ncbi:YopX protein [compost metagenome]
MFAVAAIWKMNRNNLGGRDPKGRGYTMGSEMEFRMWDTEEKQFMNHSRVIESKVLDLEKNGDGRFIYQQYSGQKECNGKGAKLFAGDIIVTDQYPLREEDGYVGVIEHDDGVFWLTRRMKSGAEVRGMSDGIADYLYEHRENNIRRIGTIFENPELLEV